jgi:hypothetical protein
MLVSTAKFIVLGLDEWPSLFMRDVTLVTMNFVGLEFPTVMEEFGNLPPIRPSFVLGSANWILPNCNLAWQWHLASLAVYPPVLWLFFCCDIGIVLRGIIHIAPSSIGSPSCPNISSPSIEKPTCRVTFSVYSSSSIWPVSLIISCMKASSS